MKYALIFCILAFTFSPLSAQQKEERDAILSMAGTYKVSFDFIETFTGDSAYQRAKNYHASAHEVVLVTENSAKKITLNHFLIVDDSIVVKHWRQDWIFENTEFLDYKGNNTWQKKSLPKKTIAGTWTQKVYQVDESPRYEAYGFWVAEAGNMVWQAVTCNSPLPRRELQVRSDYNIMQRRSRIVIGKNFWYLEQDNYKMKNDTMICHEKGMEYFAKADFNTSYVSRYWNKTENIWKHVSSEWNTLIETNNHIFLSGQLIRSDYQSGIFDLVRELSKSGKDDASIRKEIHSFILEKCKITLVQN